MSFIFDKIIVRDAPEYDSSVVVDREFIPNRVPISSTDLDNWNVIEGTGTLQVDTVNLIKNSYVWKYTASSVGRFSTQVIETEFYIQPFDLNGSFALSINYQDASTPDVDADVFDMQVYAEIVDNEDNVLAKNLVVLQEPDQEGLFNLNFKMDAGTFEGYNKYSFKLRLKLFNDATMTAIDFRFNNVSLTKSKFEDFKKLVSEESFIGAESSTTSTSNVELTDLATTFNRNNPFSNILVKFNSVSGTNSGYVRAVTSTIETEGQAIFTIILYNKYDIEVARKVCTVSTSNDSNTANTRVPPAVLDCLFTKNELNTFEDNTGVYTVKVFYRKNADGASARIAYTALNVLEI